MKRTFLIVLVLLAAQMVAFGQRKSPTFHDFKVRVYSGKATIPKLESKRSRLFQTSLRKAARRGVNFGGHYALTYWGCGASCGVGAIVDLVSGKVSFPNQLDGVWAQDWPHNTEKEIPFGFRKDSRLLILHGYLPGDYGGERRTYGLHYFLWNGSKLSRVRFERKDWRNDE